LTGFTVLFIYITRLASNKIHRELGRAKDLSAPLYFFHNLIFFCSNNQFFINVALKVKYLHSHIKVKISTHLYFIDTAHAEALST